MSMRILCGARSSVRLWPACLEVAAHGEALQCRPEGGLYGLFFAKERTHRIEGMPWLREALKVGHRERIMRACRTPHACDILSAETLVTDRFFGDALRSLR